MMRILVTGLTGQVSRAIQSLASAEVEIVALGRPALDLGVPETTHSAITAARPDIIISAAAYTAVDRAESERDLAFAINAHGPAHIGEAAARLGIPVIHLSTDYVFDGTKSAPFLETDAVNPLSVYGASKLEGEQRLIAANPRSVIFRTSWVFAQQGSNFVRTMLRLGSERDELRVVADQTGAPTFAADIAAACLQAASQLARAPGDQELYGIFHLTAHRATSWAGFAEAIFEEAGQRGWPAAKVVPITTAEYPTAAKRPANSRLDCSKLAAVYGIRLPDWSGGMRRCLDLIAADRAAGQGT